MSPRYMGAEKGFLMLQAVTRIFRINYFVKKIYLFFLENLSSLTCKLFLTSCWSATSIWDLMVYQKTSTFVGYVLSVLVYWKPLTKTIILLYIDKFKIKRHDFDETISFNHRSDPSKKKMVLTTFRCFIILKV